MENIVDVNGDFIGLLREDGTFETKAEALKRIEEFDYPALRAHINAMREWPWQIAKEFRKQGEEAIKKYDLTPLVEPSEYYAQIIVKEARILAEE